MGREQSPPRAAPPEVIGRDDELGALFQMLDRGPADGPAAIALEGEAGIGKSTIWRAAIDAARGCGLRVLSARTAEPERGVAYAGLGDLFEPVLDEVLPGLTPPRRRALEVALLVEDAGDGAVDPRALGVAVRSAVELLAEDGLLIAIDDLQWLDGASAGALGFALRRLPDEELLLLWTRRLGEDQQRSAVEDALDPTRVERVRIGPLSVGAIHRILRGRLSRVLPRPTLIKLHEVSGGNPFYALELARALDAVGAVRDPTRPLPVPERLEELVSARLDVFTGATRDALTLAAADSRLSTSQLRSAGIDPLALEPALDEGVIELRHDAVRFAQPLLASVLYQGLSAPARQLVHARLAALASDPRARARHLALSTYTPDAALSAELEEAAAAASLQGASSLAAELAEHALRLTPIESLVDVGRRTVAAARAHLASGEIDRARVVARELLARAQEPGERAEALALLAEVDVEHIQTAISLLTEALPGAAARPVLLASIHQRLSLHLRFTKGLAAAAEHAEKAVELANRLGDPGMRASALASLAIIRFNAGEPDALRLAKQAHGLGGIDAGMALAHILVWSFRLEEARQVLETLRRKWEERDELVAANILWYLALVELRAGRLSLAEEHASQARDLSGLYARGEGEVPQNLFPLLLLAAERGDVERARELAEEAATLAELHGARLPGVLAMLGTVELLSGDPAAALVHYEAAEASADDTQWGEPGLRHWRADQVEALLELGRVDESVALLDAWEAEARRLGRDWVLAHATRCRGLVAAAQGEVDGALALLADAVVRHEAAGDRHGRARSLLMLGVTRRRSRKKRAAREAIEAARAGFAEIGASGWANRAQNELGRIGGRTRSEGLTPAERRVADLVATGRTNAEVAATLFLSERTVATQLSHVYAKLGLRSRTELARKLG